MFASLQTLEEVDQLLDEALIDGFELTDSPAAVAAIRLLESVRSKTAALAIDLQGEIDRAQAFRADGHVSAKVMTRHVGRLSSGEAAARERGVRMRRCLPRLTDDLAAGALGADQLQLLARVHSNPRVREAMIDAQEWFCDRARRLSFADFELTVREWERLADMDGAAQANARNHDNRNVSLLHNRFDLSWRLAGGFGSGQGASIDDIYGHYIAAERLSDWEKAKSELGDKATASDLPRTEQQRRADALWQVFQDAAAADNSAVPPGFVHNCVWDAAAYEEMLHRLDGEAPQPLDPTRYRCETIDGVPLEPLEAAASSLVAKVRRVVVDAAGVVIDLGRARRFTGSARTAVQLSTSHCPWPGCAVPSSHCEIDHTVDYASGGRTYPGNGGPFCGRHNRWKQKGFTVWRDPAGEWHIHRRDGTEID